MQSYRADLERLATLDASSITLACTEVESLPALIAHCVDEHLELDILADDAEFCADAEHAVYLRQEAAAWRSTATLLRVIATTARPTGMRSNSGAA